MGPIYFACLLKRKPQAYISVVERQFRF